MIQLLTQILCFMDESAFLNESPEWTIQLQIFKVIISVCECLGECLDSDWPQSHRKRELRHFHRLPLLLRNAEVKRVSRDL